MGINVPQRPPEPPSVSGSKDSSLTGVLWAILTWLIWVVLVYLAVAFVNLEISFLKWGAEARVMVVVFGAFLGMLPAHIVVSEIEMDKKESYGNDTLV
jgi:hypothetical protein